MSPNKLSWVPINSPACPRRCVASLEQYPVAGSMTRCSEPARHITSLLTQHQDRGVRRRRSRYFYVTNYQELWIQAQESHSLAQISWNNFMPALLSGILSVQIESPNWNEVSGTMGDTVLAPGNAWHTYRVFYTHHEETTAGGASHSATAQGCLTSHQPTASSIW